MSFIYVQYNIVLQIIINNNNYNKQRLINSFKLIKKSKIHFIVNMINLRLNDW